MSEEKIVQVAAGYQLLTSNSLERYRAETFLSKEPETVAWIDTLFADGQVFFDIGANVGIYAIYAALRYPDSQLYAFEPYLKNINHLVANARLNGVKNLVPLYMGLSDGNGVEKLYVKDERFGASGSQIGSNVDEHGKAYEVLDEEFVPVMTVDSFVATMNVAVPDHIKIDVDGIESRIIRGMTHTLAQPRVKSVLVEVNLDAADFNELRQIFIAAGFRDDHELNRLPNHSRNRRKGTASEKAENIIFTRL